MYSRTAYASGDLDDGGPELGIGPDNFMHRRNTDRAALGRVRRSTCMGVKWYFPPWWWTSLLTFAFTASLVVGNMMVTWNHLHVAEVLVCFAILAVGHFAAMSLITADPGIYPRLLADEEDPLREDMELIYCRVCQMRRPPRTSHCYQCNVCVLEHDHHCGILGACVGVRSLRWFVLYLLCVSSATVMGLWWQLRYLFSYFVTGVDMNLLVSTPTPADGASVLSESFLPALSVAIAMTDLAVGGMLSAAALYYLSLTLTNTTRRQSQRHETSWSALRHPKLLLHNLTKTMHPPHSLVEGRPVEPDRRFLV